MPHAAYGPDIAVRVACMTMCAPSSATCEQLVGALQQDGSGDACKYIGATSCAHAAAAMHLPLAHVSVCAHTIVPPPPPLRCMTGAVSPPESTVCDWIVDHLGACCPVLVPLLWQAADAHG